MANDHELKIGWAQADITPNQPVSIAGQFYARVSEGVLNPLTVTALALESASQHAVFVSCDLVTISDDLSAKIRSRLKESERANGLDPSNVIIHATHTHTGPEVRVPTSTSDGGLGFGVDLGDHVMTPEKYVAYAADQIAQAVNEAWAERKAGGVSYGQGFAVIGRNRRWVNEEGNATMYRLNEAAVNSFRHIEGYEDHSVNLLATYDKQNNLTGLLVNVACPSQEGENAYVLSADFWHETREEIRRRYGQEIFILPQCSAAGDLSPHLLYDKKVHERMLKLKGRTVFEEIAHRLANAIDEILPYIGKSIQTSPLFIHHVHTVELTPNRLTDEDAQFAQKEAEKLRVKYEEEKRKLELNPALRDQPHWYKEVTIAYRRMNWYGNVVKRYEQQGSSYPAEVHTIRLGEVAWATNPFEYYLDYGIQIKVRSPAIQTFLVQLAGKGSYVPSLRSTSGGGYGSVPASNPVGPEGGQQLADYTVQAIRSLWNEAKEGGNEYV